MRDFAKLEGKMRETRTSQEQLAIVLKINPSTLNQKLKGITDFKLSELVAIANYFELRPEEVTEYFFN